MTRLQATLLLALLTLAALLVGRVAVDLLAPLVGLGVASGLALLRGVPEGIWWTAFGLAWWIPCHVAKRHRRHARCASRAVSTSS